MSTGWISDSDLSRVRRRHEGIEQEALVDAPGMPIVEASESKAPSVRSVRWERCPHHVGLTNTGLIPGKGKELVFRPHTKWVGKFCFPCPGSGLVWTDNEVPV